MSCLVASIVKLIASHCVQVSGQGRTKQPTDILEVSLCLHTPSLLSAEPEAAHLQACLNERPREGLGEVVGGLRGVMEAEALQLNAETQALHHLKVL